MSVTRLIGICTTNDIKVKEIAWDFAYYGIDVVKIPSPLDCDDMDKFFSTHILNGKKYKPISIIKETSTLCDVNNHGIIYTSEQLTQLQRVCHHSTIHVYFPDDSEKTWSNVVYGFIDFTRKTNDPDVFDWDDIFVVEKCNKTYWELNKLNHKYSARDLNISAYIESMIYYKANVDLKHFPQNYTRCVDFYKDPSKFILSVNEFSNPIAKKLNLSNIPINALNNGMFFRSAINRRQKLYWCPGLNAGIPFVPKPKDRAHELTFMFHDFSHWAMPDLIFTGTHSPLIQKVYIGYRLMSEAITLVLGDMLFVYSMLNSSFDYKTVEARKIYPVFTKLYDRLFDGSRTNEEAIRILLLGSYEYCFYGDLTIWSLYMEPGPETDQILSDFTGKYDSYFLEDFRWTNLNYNYMKDYPKQYVKWWEEIKPIIQDHNLNLYSVSEWIEKFNLDQATNTRELNQLIFDSVYNTWIKPLLTQPIELNDKKDRLLNTFTRYMCGQSLIFFKFDNSLHTDSYNRWLNIKNTFSYLKNNEITWEKLSYIVANTRTYYEKYLECLSCNSLISRDDYHTYQDIYPIFKPFIVDYDGLEEKKNLAEFSELMLSS